MDIQNCDGEDYLVTIEDNSIDLVLTDPPYVISNENTGMNILNEQVKSNKDKNIKTEEDWEKYSKTLFSRYSKEEIESGKGNGWSKDNYLKYGHIQGKKYAKQTNFGEWDINFSRDKLRTILEKYYQKLKNGGTVIIWYDIWKISELKEDLEKCGFKQIRFIEWIKTNPQPINSKLNYLSNSREIGLTAVKKSKPTFNSEYDKGVYYYPIASGKNKFHPTQKNLKLFEDLIRKHSNEGDIVLDTFLGGGTTAFACKNLNRNFKGCEIDKEYFDRIKKDLLEMTYIRQ